ncbi:MAG: NAD-dependent epimerase [Lachnospiraceae bacterium]|nr:NAD-dependent epimerase [Lachnospiraceae bacterium]
MRNNELETSKTYLVTGAAGFIGYYLSKALLDKGAKVIGIDNMNDYYDVSIKEHRLSFLKKYDLFKFVKMDISDKEAVFKLFEDNDIYSVINLAAQAGVRYSIQNPDAYINSNIIGFFNILEACRHYPVEHLLYASSSSVYGGNKKVPFSVEDKVDNPVSLYAATKKSNELMAYSYSKLYGIKSTGLRFFTVYGPMGRPDMAAFLFADAIMHDRPIKVFNNGDMKRDFTYIDDIIAGIMNIIPNPPLPDEGGVCYKVYNIGNNKPEDLMTFIGTLEEVIGKEAKKEFLPMQPGDVPMTYADVTDLINDFGFKPDTSIKEGLSRFANWYKEYYSID